MYCVDRTITLILGSYDRVIMTSLLHLEVRTYLWGAHLYIHTGSRHMCYKRHYRITLLVGFGRLFYLHFSQKSLSSIIKTMIIGIILGKKGRIPCSNFGLSSLLHLLF